MSAGDRPVTKKSSAEMYPAVVGSASSDDDADAPSLAAPGGAWQPHCRRGQRAAGGMGVRDAATQRGLSPRPYREQGLTREPLTVEVVTVVVVVLTPPALPRETATERC